MKRSQGPERRQTMSGGTGKLNSSSGGAAAVADTVAPPARPSRRFRFGYYTVGASGTGHQKNDRLGSNSDKNKNNNSPGGGLPVRYIESLTKYYGTLEGLDLANDVLEVQADKKESYRTAYLRKGRSLLERSPAAWTFEQATRTPEFQALTAAYKIMTTPGWRKHYEKHGFVNSLSSMVDHDGGRLPLLADHRAAEAELAQQDERGSRSPTRSQLILPIDDSRSTEEVAMPMDGTGTSAVLGSPPDSSSRLLQRCHSWGGDGDTRTVNKKKSSSPTTRLGGNGSGNSNNIKLTVRQRVLRWNDQPDPDKKDNNNKSKENECSVVSPSSVIVQQQQGFSSAKEAQQQPSSAAGTTIDSDTQSVVVAKELFKEMTRPFGATTATQQQQPKTSISAILLHKKGKKKPKVHVDFDDLAIQDDAVSARMNGDPLPNDDEVTGHETLLDGPADAADSPAPTPPIDLGETRVLTKEQALANMSTEATTRGYVRIERLLDDANTATPSAMETSAITFFSQGSDHRPIDQAATPVYSFYQMLGLGSVNPKGVVSEVQDIEFLTTIDGYVKKVADGIESLSHRFTCEMGKVDQVIGETFTIPDENVGGMLDVLGVENKECEGVLREFYEHELATASAYPLVHKSFTM